MTITKSTPQRPLTLRIRDVKRATSRSAVVKIALDGRLFTYRAGQAIKVANHGTPNPRAYSLAAGPDTARRDYALELLIATDPAGNAGPHLTLEPGSLVDVDGPVGGFVFPEMPDIERFCFIAGGTGIAPLRAMLHEALKRRGSTIRVLYSARTRHDFAYATELQDLVRRRRIDLRQTVTREPAPDKWTGAFGRIGRQDLEWLAEGESALYFVCGPPPFVGSVIERLAEMNVPPERIRAEEWVRQVVSQQSPVGSH